MNMHILGLTVCVLIVILIVLDIVKNKRIKKQKQEIKRLRLDISNKDFKIGLLREALSMNSFLLESGVFAHRDNKLYSTFRITKNKGALVRISNRGKNSKRKRREEPAVLSLKIDKVTSVSVDNVVKANTEIMKAIDSKEITNTYSELLTKNYDYY